MNKDLIDLIEEKKDFIKENRGSKDPGIIEKKARLRQLIFALKKHKGICPICGKNPICLKLAENATMPICTQCEAERRENSGKRITYEQVLIKAVNTKPLVFA